MSYIELNGADIYYEHNIINAENPTLIFLHDSLGSVELWRDFPSKVANAFNYNLLIYDREGYGKSSAFRVSQRDQFYMHHEADFLEDLVQQLNLNNIILFGHSDGGTIALLYAAKYPERLKGIITEGAHIFVEEITLKGIRAVGEIYKNTNLHQRLTKYHGENTSEIFRLWQETWQAEYFADWNIENELKTIECPTLVIQGIDDEFGSVKQVEGIQQNIAARCEVFIVPDTKHNPHKENVEMTLAKTIDFIKTLS